MRWRRQLAWLVVALLVCGGAVWLARVLVVRRATPELVAQWLEQEATRLGVPVQFEGLRAPEPGLLHLGSLEFRLPATGPEAARVRAEEVRIVYALSSLRPSRVRVQHVRAHRLDVRLTPALVSPAEWAGAEAAGGVRLAEEAAQRLATLLADAQVLVAHGAIVLQSRSTKEGFRYTGERWIAQISARGDRVALSGGANSADLPDERGEVDVLWRRGRPLRITLTGTVPDAAAAWRRATTLVPAVADVPVQWSRGAAAWRTTLTGVGRPAWQAEGSLHFAGAQVQVGPLGMAAWTGTCRWELGGDPETSATTLRSLSLQTNQGDLTATGEFDTAGAGRDFAGDLSIYGLSGAVLEEWLTEVPWPSAGGLRAIGAGDADAITAEVRLERNAGALRGRAEVRAGRGALRADLGSADSFLTSATVAVPHAVVKYDAQRGTAQGRVVIADGAVQFRLPGLAATRVRGELAFAPDGYRLEPVRLELPGASLALTGHVPAEDAEPLDVRVEGHVTDLATFARPFGLPPSVRLEGAAGVTGTARGPRHRPEMMLSLDGTAAHFAVGRVVEKAAGAPARLAGTFRPREGGLQGDLSVTFPDARLTGSVLMTPRPGARRDEGADPFLEQWDLMVSLASPTLPLPTLRRLAPVTQRLHGYGSAAIAFVYDDTLAGRLVEAWMDAEEVRFISEGSPLHFALVDSEWYLRSDVAAGTNQLKIRGDQVDLLDPLPRVGGTDPPPAGPPVPGPSARWSTTAEVAFDRLRWRGIEGADLTGRLTHARGTVSLDDVHLAIFGGTAAGRLELEASREMTGSVRWAGCAVDAALTALYDVAGAARGDSSGHARFAGTLGEWPRWRGSGQVTANLLSANPRYFGVEANRLPFRTVSADWASAQFTFADGTFVVPDLRVERPGIGIRGHGHIDLEGDLRFKCFAQIDNALVERLPLLARVQFTKPVSPEAREIEFSLRDNIRRLRPKVHHTSVPFMLQDFGRGSVTRSGRLLLDLLGL